MATGIHTWSKTASSNSSADSSINFAEGQAPSSVNDSARALMARVAEYRDDNAGTLTTGGTSTAYTLTTNTVFTSLALLNGQKLKVKFNATNGSSPTLNVDSLGAKALQLYSGTAIPTGMILANSILDVTYDNSASAFIVAAIPAVVPSLTVTGGLTVNGTITGASGAITPSVLPPQGRLTLTSATPILAADVTAATTIYYTPYVGNFLPIFNGTSCENISFTEMSMAMSGANFAANAIYDMFAAYDSTTLRIGIGPVWSTLTAGAGARGTGAGTTELERVNGLYLNKNSMTIRYASGSTFTAAAQRATYLGTIFMDGTNSQISCTIGYGQTRKWGVWNAYNRKRILLKAGDSTASWTVGGAGSVRAQNGNSSNSLATICGLPEETIDLGLEQHGQIFSNQATSAITGFLKAGIGINSTSAFSGKVGFLGQQNNNMSANLVIGTDGDLIARHSLVPSIGTNSIIACEQLQNSLFQTLYGGEDDMILSASWMG